MVILTATYRNGVIKLEQPLLYEFEGKHIQGEEIKGESQKPRRQTGSSAGQIWMDPDLDEPLEEAEENASKGSH